MPASIPESRVPRTADHEPNAIDSAVSEWLWRTSNIKGWKVPGGWEGLRWNRFPLRRSSEDAMRSVKGIQVYSSRFLSIVMLLASLTMPTVNSNGPTMDLPIAFRSSTLSLRGSGSGIQIPSAWGCGHSTAPS